jgi:hypothetical protein
MKEEDQETIRIGLTLEGEMKKRFLAIKKQWGLENNTDVVRMLITREHEKIATGRSES